MTRAKLALSVVADGYDRVDGVPLVRITKGEPEMWVVPVRVMLTMDLRPRPKWNEWEALVTIRFDADMLTASSS